MTHSEIRFMTDDAGFRSDKPLTLRDMPEGFVVRRLQNTATPDDRAWVHRELAEPFGSGYEFAKSLHALDAELKRVKFQVLEYLWDNAKITITHSF